MSQSSSKSRTLAQLLLSALVMIAASRLGSAQSATGQTVPPGHGANASSYTPQRVYDAREKRYTDFESMLFDLAKHEVVFVGEQHDDPATHRLERAILEGLARRR
ncbi:MAG: ChaN family lipoprotein, partial [Acidobacteriota bacterium]